MGRNAAGPTGQAGRACGVCGAGDHVDGHVALRVLFKQTES